MNRGSRSLAAILAALLVSGCASATGTDPSARIDAYLRPLVAAGQFSGVVLAVRDRRIIYEKAFGMANAELGVPNTVDSRFCIASITKDMTRTIGIALLVEGKMGLKDPLKKWIPDFPSGDEITIEWLMRHRSGIPHRVTTPEEETQRYTPADMVEKAKHATLAFTPGERSLYSSAGYSVLARVLELAAGKSYDDLLARYVIEPAGMTETVDFDGEALIMGRAQEYLLEPSGIVHAPLMDYSFLVGAGSVFSTVGDVRRFAEAVMDTTYGLGPLLSLVKDGVLDLNGSTNGYRCFGLVDPEHDYELFVAANLESGANDLLRRDLPKILEGEDVPPPTVPAPTLIDVPASRLADYTGTYVQGDSSFDIDLRNGRLFAGRHLLAPTGEDAFFSYTGYSDVTFERDASGRVTELTWAGVGGSSTWMRERQGDP